MNRILKLEPFYSEKIWGYEEWNLSIHQHGQSTIQNTQMTLLKHIGESLPILVKIIHANDILSVQVHPNDGYSRIYENDNGKTELWYRLEAEENACLTCGIKENTLL